LFLSARGRTRVAVANGNRLVDGGFQAIVLLVRLGDEDMALFQAVEAVQPTADARRVSRTTLPR
jgi:hypothetical protein